jgi:hypothetical protein
MAKASPDLSIRSGSEELAAYTDPTEKPSFRLLLDADACADTWRIIEVSGNGVTPFEVELSWSAGTGSGARARMVVARGTRVCVFARALRVRVANLGNAVNRVGVTVADGFAPTANQWEVRGGGAEQVGGGGGPQEVPIPPFADRFRVETADPVQLPLVVFEVQDGLGTVRNKLSGDKQPGAGNPLGAAGKLIVTVPAGIAWRVVFYLVL